MTLRGSLALVALLIATGCFQSHRLPSTGTDSGYAMCGAVACSPGTECCNASCGICTPPGVGCIGIECSDAGAPSGDCRVTGCDAGRECGLCWTEWVCLPPDAVC